MKLKVLVFAFLASLISIPVNAQRTEMKLAYFVGDQHAMSQWLIRWSEQLEKGSGGRLAVKRFPGAQMGPTPGHYDFARTGQADAAWFLHGGTPGRFPLTELVSLPYLVGSAEIGVKVCFSSKGRGEQRHLVRHAVVESVGNRRIDRVVDDVPHSALIVEPDLEGMGAGNIGDREPVHDVAAPVVQHRRRDTPVLQVVGLLRHWIQL